MTCFVIFIHVRGMWLAFCKGGVIGEEDIALCSYYKGCIIRRTGRVEFSLFVFGGRHVLSSFGLILAR